MSREVRSIPPAPRTVPLRKVLGYRWPMLACAVLLAVYGGVWTWMFFLAGGGKAADARRLDRGPRVQAEAVVTKVEPSGQIDGGPADRVQYRFEHGGLSRDNASFAPRGTFTPGQRVPVELIDQEPRISRLVGARLHLLPEWTRPGTWFVLLVVPGLLLGLGYLAGVFHLYRVLAHGDAGVAVVTAVRRVPLCLPETWSVRFTFRDHNARERRSRHWVRAHSPLGARLRPMLTGEQSEQRVPVLHDRRWPQYCRLVVVDEFRQQPAQTPRASQPS